MSWTEEYIDTISQAMHHWLKPDNDLLEGALKKTVREGLFSREDIEYQLSVLRENLQQNELIEWVKRCGLNEEQNAKGRKVLCLHAGNLPLVGFQTALGTLLSGADYYGKLSRKDPYLLASFLEELKHAGMDQIIDYSTDISEFRNLNADKIVFAGSIDSVPEVKTSIRELQAAREDAEFIIRTAKFSMAYLTEWNEMVKKQLVEGMLRYGGKGCRSIAVVVASVGLDQVKEELEEAVQAFWKKNPVHQKPAPLLNYQFAYNEAVQRKQLWLQDLLIQETDELPDQDFTVHWVKGGEQKVRELRDAFGTQLQTVYTTGGEAAGLETEPLSMAQCPPLYWKPDGVDVITALIE